MDKQYYVYILTNYDETVLYTGVTNNLGKRIYEHKNKLIKSFSQKYNLNKLVYYEIYNDIEQAIIREKQIKGGSRVKKLDLINKFNEEWLDLYEKIC
ncbi:MAG: GIY-YIG nuclease family protein [Candidatus Gastranaerophilales bacterium]|nr:GIY-YIG nuclease family protein [Candidatus Gastranaerophilales bacterium]